MKKEEVPQDESYLSKANVSEINYAVDKDGNYTKVSSSGWKTKTIALDESLQVLEERLQETRKKIKTGDLSPIAYFMELHKMDIPILASYAGLCKWRVKRHLKPKHFKKLSNKTLRKYAKVFEVDLTELKNPNL
ncbi:MAG TPA: hypothetical protein VFM65_09820 [Flavobacteriaceae bacterium]|nr:hypothetical protein [Flavobacteriaceae bacterium]